MTFFSAFIFEHHLSHCPTPGEKSDETSWRWLWFFLIRTRNMPAKFFFFLDMFLAPATQIGLCVGSGRLSMVGNVDLKLLAARTTSAAWELSSWRWWHTGGVCHRLLSSCLSRVILDSAAKPPFWQTRITSRRLRKECWLDYHCNIAALLD